MLTFQVSKVILNDSLGDSGLACKFANGKVEDCYALGLHIYDMEGRRVIKQPATFSIIKGPKVQQADCKGAEANGLTKKRWKPTLCCPTSLSVFRIGSKREARV